ncbi:MULTISPECIES: GNAT family N-acetyltransferase [unclassified Paracoccus (in: a-proteobacteria)]|uniref:GNAT family N-acetyltransferase n=1 Tax=unclassified Paracoccus (in: a-proteobacteria) TaxID=2688777 RepID=UPI0012B3657A|nr:MULTISPECIES: GNAT family N-acetyltransferase [unclassified Paracoccus (in: a-proteobacteria)]UXU75802.1 N-acetyltransferase [Paracoccus sp. SMMA_5]UXU81711.1 N-acetyltransferase [Paracoccus sp. SMMA_5_TC]
MSEPSIHVRHEDNGTSGRYVASLPGHSDQAELTWHNGGPGVIVADHTYAPPSMRGTGVAAAMMRQLVADARQRGVRILPTCSYVRVQLARHPEWADLQADTQG